MSKNDRLIKIKEIITSKSISNQEELQQHLKDEGYLVTQATLSRDLKNLKVVKVANPNGSFKYIIQDGLLGAPAPRMPETIEGILSMEFSGQFGVIKTIPGFANAIAYFIDRLKLSEIMGTIAGDDTILIIACEGVSKNLLAGIFSKYFKGLQHKIL